MKKIVRFFFFIFLFFHVSLSAQDSTLYDIHINKKYLLSYPLNTKEVLIAPFKMDEKSMLRTGGVICLAGGLMLADRDIQSLIQRNKTIWLNDISKYGLEPWGSGVYTAPLLGLLYLHGKITKNNRMESVALLAAQSSVISAGVVQLPKYFFQRQRPFQNNPSNPFFFEGPWGAYKFNSMPSGHTTLAFAAASMINMEYHDKKWVGAIAYTLATLTGISRIYDNKHWASDVILGAAIGTGVSRIIYMKSRKRKLSS